MRTLGALAYIDNGQELLLLHRNKKENDVHAGKWIGVGGKFEFGESPEQCVVREIKEETGLIVQEMQMVGILTFPSFTPNQDWFVFVFRVTQFSGAVQPCSEGTLAWVPYDEVLALPTWEGDRLFLPWILEHKPFFSATFRYESEQLISHDVVFYEGDQRKQ